VAFVNGLICRQTLADMLWSSKQHPSYPWYPPGRSRHSPLIGAIEQEAGEIEGSISVVLAAIAAFRADFDAYKALPSPTLSPVLTAIAGLQTLMATDFATVNHNAAANQTAVMTLLTEILAAVKALTAPTRLTEDLAHATHRMQSVPTTKGD
jgi:hypothetical protein